MTEDPNIQMLERAVDLLDPLDIDIVYIGGATVSLFLDDPAAPDLRSTDDVDCVVSATTYVEFAQVEKVLRDAGFSQLDVEAGPICRWQKEGLLFDVLPSDPSAIGFSESEWFEQGLKNAVERELPSGRKIEVFDPPHMLAAKIEAYRERGNGDYMTSKDFEDIVTMLNSRKTIFDELSQDRQVCEFVRAWLAELHDQKLSQMLASHILESGRVKVLQGRISKLLNDDRA